MSEISVKELAVKTREAMRAKGVSEHSLWRQYDGNLQPVVRWFRRNGHEMFSEEMAYLYLTHLDGRLERGEITRWYRNYLRKGIVRMMEAYGCSTPEWGLPQRGSKYKFNEYYEKLLTDFSTSDKFHKNTLGDIVWVSRKFFAWLCEKGHHNLALVGADEIQNFVIDCSKSMKINSIHNVKLYLKKLCVYLHSQGLLANSFEGLLSFRVSRQSKLSPTTPPYEIEAILNLVDRSTQKGKRDYAMFMLAIVTGLRAIDILRLKLTDIDWRRGEINLQQSKTGQNLQLPLTADIGEALQDYILNARQKVNEPHVFLRIHPPYKAFTDAVSIGDIYDEYRIAAGFERKAFDGKSFHSLRRTVGTNLVTSDIAVTDAAQLLGKMTPRSMDKYIALDITHLKECALDFSDIESEVLYEKS